MTASGLANSLETGASSVLLLALLGYVGAWMSEGAKRPAWLSRNTYPPPRVLCLPASQHDVHTLTALRVLPFLVWF